MIRRSDEGDLPRRSDDAERAEGSMIRANTARVFQGGNAQPPVTEAVRSRIEHFVTSCADSLRESLSLECALTPTEPIRGRASDVIALASSDITASVLIEEWNARAIFRLDRLMFFKIFDAMYGGNGVERTSTPQRGLTEFETSVAKKIAEIISREIGVSFAAHSPLTIADLACPHLASSTTSPQTSRDYIAFDVLVLGPAECLSVALPANAVSILKNDGAVKMPRSSAELDPSWRVDLESSMTRASIDLIAITDTGDLELGDVSALQPGSLIEFDGSRLNTVRLESGDEVVFIGRLGKSNGFYTIGIDETMLPPPLK